MITVLVDGNPDDTADYKIDSILELEAGDRDDLSEQACQ